MMLSGIVYYRRVGTSLVGKWSHEKTNGMLADEVIQNVPVGSIEGSWPVEISVPDAGLIFRGQVTISKLGESLRFEWNGTDLTNNTNASYAGIGIAFIDLIFASFEPAGSDQGRSTNKN
jgi:hypothetical protein